MRYDVTMNDTKLKAIANYNVQENEDAPGGVMVGTHAPVLRRVRNKTYKYVNGEAIIMTGVVTEKFPNANEKLHAHIVLQTNIEKSVHRLAISLEDAEYLAKMLNNMVECAKGHQREHREQIENEG